MTAHRYWRALIHSNGAGGSNCSVGEIYGYEAGFDGQRLTGGTASASSTLGGFPASNAFDGDITTFWNTATFVDPTWLKYDLGAGVTRDIRQITIYGRQDNFFNQNPTSLDWQWSDDDVTYTTAFSLTIPAFTGPGQSYSSPSPGPTFHTRSTQTEALVAYNIPSPLTKLTGALTLTAITYPSTLRSTEGEVKVAAVYNLNTRLTQGVVLVAILQGAEERQLRAWSFKQDDHEFYVLQASLATYVYDKLTEQWCQWKSPNSGYWQAIDGVDWNGINVACDPDSGNLYKIDPSGRLDYGTTPITSVVYGGLTDRFRDSVPAYMLEIAISQASPAGGSVTAAITLDSYDTLSWVNHGSVTASSVGTATWPRFYGLGQISAPGRLFRVTDTGVARRIDGMNLEVGTNG